MSETEQTLPAPLVGAQGHVDRFGPDLIDGWITLAANRSPPVPIDIIEHGAPVGRIVADVWRTDLAETRQGDGRWGFTALPPACLADGEAHLVQLALADGTLLLAAPIRVRFNHGAHLAALPRLRDPPYEPEPACRSRPGPAPDPAPGQILISFVVVFFNMAREAVRTLTSLQRSYQRDAGTIEYEVTCIDNGSRVPIDADWLAGLGPEFRLIRIDDPCPSPVALMNQAARSARGHHLALMIDGAHILSPGVLREAAEAIAEAPGAVIGLRQWFIGGDQRFLARSGWTRAQEDMLFDRIAWPSNGYHLFHIATPVWESPNHWFDGMSESNCLFVPASLFASIGGFDEAFDEPGAGYANLDLFRRAVEASSEPVVALVGEASFHQFHDGTTTNVAHDEKEAKVRTYGYKYARLRGKNWAPIDPGSIRLRGQIRTRSALVTRQRPLVPARVGVTDAVRPAELSTHFDRMAADYLVSTYAEAGLHRQANWRGQELGVAPPDAMEIAAVLHQVRPTRVVAVHLPAGLLGFLRDAAALEPAGPRFVVVGEGGIGGDGATDPLDDKVFDAVREAVGPAIDVVVLLAARAQSRSLLAELNRYASLVSLRSYLVVAGSAFGQPWLGYSRNWTMKAINSFADTMPFAIDTGRTSHLITSCPLGFLQRIGPVESGDAAGAVSLVGVS